MELSIKKELQGVSFHYIDSGKKHFFNWLFNSLIEKTARLLFPLVNKNVFWASIAVSKRSWQLLRWTKSNNVNPHLVIAHNPAAFYPAYRIAKKNKIPFAIDIEDFHPGEANNSIERKSVSYLMQQLMPKAAYISFASTLIKKHSLQMGINLSKKDVVINNIFSKMEYALPREEYADDKKIKLIWFSQVIDFGRGLEKILAILDEFQDHFNLSLIGNCRQQFYEQEIKKRTYIHCTDAMEHLSLQKELSKHDIGLAVEDNNENFNRDICLTNKIWSYFQAGLYIIATNTTAQKEFIKEHASHGLITSLQPHELRLTFTKIIDNKTQLISKKIERFSIAENYNWENESKELVKYWEAILA
jgi:glycosyltransferase involved in cell wall biosynthesis